MVHLKLNNIIDKIFNDDFYYKKFEESIEFATTKYDVLNMSQFFFRYIKIHFDLTIDEIKYIRDEILNSSRIYINYKILYSNVLDQLKYLQIQKDTIKNFKIFMKNNEKLDNINNKYSDIFFNIKYQKIICACGVTYNMSYYKNHIKSFHHIDYDEKNYNVSDIKHFSYIEKCNELKKKKKIEHQILCNDINDIVYNCKCGNNYKHKNRHIHFKSKIHSI